MKQTILFAALGLVAAGAGAQEVGRVISSTPVIQQVAVPRTYCNQPVYQGEPQTSGAGGLMGAIAGAGIGSQIGHGGGTAAAMMIGAVGGALLGNNIEANGARQAPQQVCGTETTYENRTLGYDVTYEYAGRQYTTRMNYDPGPTVQVQVTPYGGAQQAAGPVVAPPVASAPQVVVTQPSPVVYQTAVPAYPVYVQPYPYYRPYFPIGISLGYVYHRGGHRWHR
jgi:uncharacterized protein YcfJ